MLPKWMIHDKEKSSGDLDDPRGLSGRNTAWVALEKVWIGGKDLLC